jgi:hypothetical protein
MASWQNGVLPHVELFTLCALHFCLKDEVTASALKAGVWLALEREVLCQICLQKVIRKSGMNYLKIVTLIIAVI